MMGFGFGGLGIVSMIIFWVVIIGLAVWFLGRLFPREVGNAAPRTDTRWHDPSESPLEILRGRYARGEISKAEYDEIRRELGG